MRATKGYVAGVGTSTALVGAICCAFAIVSAVMAVHALPLSLSAPGVETLDDSGAVSASASLLAIEGPFGFGGWVGDAAARGRARGPRQGTTAPGDAAVGLAGEPVATAPGTGGFAGGRGGSGAAPHQVAAGGPGASSAGSAPVPGAGTAPPAGGGTGGGTAPPPAAGLGPTSPVGEVVTQASGAVGGTVTQTGQQLGGAVQGATQQAGTEVGQVSPTVGQAVTQAGQATGGVVSAATGTVGQVVTGAGAVVGGLLGGSGG